MIFDLVGTSPLLRVTLLSLLLAPSQGLNVNRFAGTNAQLAARNDLDSRADSSYSTHAAPDAGEKVYSIPDTADLEPELAKRSLADVHAKIFTATFNNPDGHGGYNISIAGNACPNTIIGDYEAPSGGVIPNATLGQIYDTMSLPSEALRNFTLSRALAVQAQLNTTLTDVICAPPAGANRALLFRYEVAEVEGFWTAYILGGTGVGVIGFWGLREAILSQSMGAISVNAEVWILAATALAQYLLVTAAFRLQHLRYFSRGEAYVLNCFIAFAEGIAASCAYRWKQTCAASSAVGTGIKSFGTAALNVVTCGACGPSMVGNPSSLNLVEQDIEQGQGQGQPHC